MVDCILQAGVQVDDGPPGVETPFICAVRNQAFRLAGQLLVNKADTNALFDRGILVSYQVPKTLLGSLIAETSPAMLGCLNFHLEYARDLKFVTTANNDWTILHKIASLDYWTTRDLKVLRLERSSRITSTPRRNRSTSKHIVKVVTELPRYI